MLLRKYTSEELYFPQSTGYAGSCTTDTTTSKLHRWTREFVGKPAWPWECGSSHSVTLDPLQMLISRGHSPMVHIAVLFATRNGAHTLPRMLDSLERLIPPAGGWRVIAVDNGSSDNSLRILRQRAGRLPMIVISEPRQGKNIALNTGLALAEGDLVALTDDDIILPPNWLISFEEIAAERTEYDIFGGSICPVWEETPPAWVLSCVPKHHLAWTDVPEGPVRPDDIWGGNMAVRAAVFRNFKFAEEFDMHSETEFTSRASGNGHRCWHFHASPVGHIIRAYQLKPAWHLQRAYRCGRGDRREFHVNTWGISARRLRRLPHHTLQLIKGIRRVVIESHHILRSWMSDDFENQLKASLRVRYFQGCIAEEYSAFVACLTPPRKASPRCRRPLVRSDGHI